MDRGLKVKNDECTKLMQEAVAGNSDAFDCLYHKFSPVLRSFLVKRKVHQVSSDDFVQEVFTRVWQGRNRFRGDSLFVTYLMSIARYTLSEKIRQSERIARVEYLKKIAWFTEEPVDNLSQPETEACLKELFAALKKARARLTSKQQQVLKLSEGTEISHHKASQKLGCSREAFRSRLKRVRKRSQQLLASILENQKNQH